MNSLNIRLSSHDLSNIIEIFKKHFLSNDELWLFGSRTYPNKKGGDIDLYIETNLSNYDLAVDAKIDFLCELKRQIGDQKIDVVINLIGSNYQLPIYNIAKIEGVKII